MKQEIRDEQIMRVFEETDHPDLTCWEIAEALDVHYMTARRHIQRLESDGILRHARSSGNTKLYEKAP